MLQAVALVKESGVSGEDDDRMHNARPAFLLLMAAFALPGCAEEARKAVSVTDATVRLPAVPGRPGAAYFTVRGGAEPAQLVAIEADGVQSVEFHESMAEGPMTTMAKLDSIDVPAGADVVFAPGGRHAMLIGIDPAIRPGDEVRLSFRFARGQPVIVEARAEAAGD